MIKITKLWSASAHKMKPKARQVRLGSKGKAETRQVDAMVNRKIKTKWKKMEFKDETLVCQDCGKEFVFSAADQKFFQEKGFQSPKRCPDCRQAKKMAKANPTMYDIVCSKCGEKGQVPFKPNNPEGLLCEKCFREKNESERK